MPFPNPPQVDKGKGIFVEKEKRHLRRVQTNGFMVSARGHVAQRLGRFRCQEGGLHTMIEVDVPPSFKGLDPHFQPNVLREVPRNVWERFF